VNEADVILTVVKVGLAQRRNSQSKEMKRLEQGGIHRHKER
jgi:hypothetical protein